MKYKHMVQKGLMWHPVNSIIKTIIKPLRNVLPKKWVTKIPVVGEVKLSLPNGSVLRLLSDGRDKIAATIFWYGLDGIEGPTTRLFLRLLKYTETFIDIGANTGVYALMAGKGNPEKRIYAFEPVPEVFDYMCRNIALNGLGNIQAVQGAVTNFDGMVSLYVEFGARLPLSASTRRLVDNMSKSLEVPAITMDSYVEKNGISKIDLMKVDTETTEPAVFDGAKSVLKRDRPFIICEVLHNANTGGALHGILDDEGYRYFLITTKGLIEKELILGDISGVNDNYLFVPLEKYDLIKDLLVPNCL